ncbi:MAG TPA: type II and III secretion system protein family protein [Tepidisphaeraceae bacterium]|jgi:pilus assembly protein CpaC|nr:type II and III secretion system protein family protein [Tepidisphaeraceae bacterium]
MSNKQLFKIGRKTALAIGTAMALWTLAWPSATPAAAQPTTTPSGVGATDESAPSQVINIEPGKATKRHFDERIKKVNVVLPDVADVIALGPNDLLITAKKSGSTQLIIWDEDDHTQIVEIDVSTPLARLQKQLVALFPESKINVEDANGTITLTGNVRDLQTASQAEQIAAPYSAGNKLVDLLEISGGQQVMLKVKFAEVSKQAEEQLGFNFGGTDGVSTFGSNVGANSLGLSTGGAAGNSLLVSNTALSDTLASMFGTGSFGPIAFAYFVDALEQNSLLRTLAEPDLVTTSGQKATFLAGGQFPYPVPQNSGGGTSITIQFQQYGVQLDFTPIVLGNGRIRLKVHPDVSQLDYSHTVTLDGTTVPGLTERSADTTVELAEGQTFALGGMLEDQISASNNQFPILGDLPIIGALFRSVSYQKNDTELVMMVTPVLVHGIDPADVPPVPGEHWRDPSIASLYWLKDLGGEVYPQPKPLKLSAEQTPSYQGPAGFQPPSAPGK